MRGRKPKHDAVRRGNAPKQQGITPVNAQIMSAEPMGIEKPESVAANPTMSQCWDLIVGEGRQYKPSDVPQLEQLCYWYAVHQQCVTNTVSADGRVLTKVGKVGEDGRPDPASFHVNPDIRTAQMAAANYRALAAELGVSPLARQRMGLMEAVTHSTQADLVMKTERYFEQMKGKLDAAD